jgi:hypothetical protein
LVKEWHNTRTEDKLNVRRVQKELEVLEDKLRMYNVPQLGDILDVQNNGIMRILVCQMGGCASKEVQEIKITATEQMIKRYDINLIDFMELNYIWSKVNSSANLASWLCKKERELHSVTAHNTQEQSKLFSKHQPGETGMICHNKFLQYARKPSVDSRGLGRWCSWTFFCNPMHTTRIVVAYKPCAAKVKGLKKVYQQQLKYIHAKGLHVTPLELFDNDLTKQLSKWHTAEERIILLLMDANKYPTEGKFSRKLAKMNLDMHKFSHKCWGPTPPYTHINSTQPIDSGYISFEIAVVNLSMLNFTDSPGNHRSLILDVSTRSLLGGFWHKVCRPVSRRLVTSQQLLVDRYNKIVREQFKIYCIKERLNAVDRMEHSQN